jgi:hypothetical protein
MKRTFSQKLLLLQLLLLSVLTLPTYSIDGIYDASNDSNPDYAIAEDSVLLKYGGSRGGSCSSQPWDIKGNFETLSSGGFFENMAKTGTGDCIALVKHITNPPGNFPLASKISFASVKLRPNQRVRLDISHGNGDPNNGIITLYTKAAKPNPIGLAWSNDQCGQGVLRFENSIGPVGNHPGTTYWAQFEQENPSLPLVTVNQNPISTSMFSANEQLEIILNNVTPGMKFTSIGVKAISR